MAPGVAPETFLAAVVATTQRQLTSTLGGMLAVTSASLLVWLITKAAERLFAAARGALFVTVEVRETKLADAVRAWAALHAYSSHSAPGAFVATRSHTPQLMLERAKRAVAAAHDRPAHMGDTLVFPVYGEAAGARSDPSSYSLFEHLPPGPRTADKENRVAVLEQRVWLGRRPVWLHSTLEGGTKVAALLAGAPAPLLRLLDNSGLRELFATSATPPGGEKRRRGRESSSSSSSKPRVFVSALRWHGAPLVRAALLAAFNHACAEERGLLKVCSVKISKPDEDRYSLLRFGGGGDDQADKLTWQEQAPMLARGMRTVVLPAAAEAVRVAARSFMDPRYGRFCRATGLAYRRGYALWGPPGARCTSLLPHE